MNFEETIGDLNGFKNAILLLVDKNIKYQTPRYLKIHKTKTFFDFLKKSRY